MPNRKYSINVYPPAQWWGFKSFLWMWFKGERVEGLFLPLQPLNEQELSWALPVALNSLSRLWLPAAGPIAPAQGRVRNQRLLHQPGHCPECDALCLSFPVRPLLHG